MIYYNGLDSMSDKAEMEFMKLLERTPQRNHKAVYMMPKQNLLQSFLIEDLLELLEHDLEPEAARGRVENWFMQLEGAMAEECIYYISDAYLWGVETDVLFDCGRKIKLEQIWQKRLEELCQNHKNVRIFPYRSLVEKLGEERTFSLKMWYMGKILHGGDAQKALCQGIVRNSIDIE